MIGLVIIAFMVYTTCGIACAIPIVIWGLPRIDESVRTSTIGFRLLMFPGCVTLWPLMLIKWVHA